MAGGGEGQVQELDARTESCSYPVSQLWTLGAGDLPLVSGVSCL